MGHAREFSVRKDFEKDKCLVVCPNEDCKHWWYTYTNATKKNFFCVKCGTDFPGERTVVQENGPKDFGVHI